MSSSSSSSSSSNKPTISISISSDPLFSTLLSFFALILLYFPRLLWRILLSPVFLLTGFLLLSLLRLGATQRSFLRQTKDYRNQSQTVSEIEYCKQQAVEQSEVVSELGSELEGAVSVSCACFEESFVQWNVRAPLEVIYEEYEGEDHHKDVSNESDPEPPQVRIGLQSYPSLSLYYPETDSDSSSDDEFPATGAWDSLDDINVCFMWDEDEDRDELIEIALDKTNKKPSEFQLEPEEDNLIEIDISPTRNAHEFPDV